MIFSHDFLLALSRARHVVVFTGAGMSAESGIATFLDALTGLWERFQPERLASFEGYQADKALVWGWYEWRRMQALQATPHAGHFAISELANHLERLTLITQNVDDLHERAGSNQVIHLHGSLHHPRCSVCHTPYQHSGEIQIEPEDGRKIEPPVCGVCNGSIRPGVVWFGETLPEDAWEAAQLAVTNCDALFSIGTSAVVRPASLLPEMAALHGAKVIQINPGATSLDARAHYNYQGKAGEVLPALVNSLAGLLDSR